MRRFLTHRRLLRAFLCGACLTGTGFMARAADEPHRPNLVLMLADDLGYGDPASYNEASKIPTPNIDGLVAAGMRFTDAHSPSGVCTPTRYGLLTGRYAWRTRLTQGVLTSYSEPLIDPDRDTLASMLKRHGYRTACVGKWHLGLGWQPLPGGARDAIVGHDDGDLVDYTKPLLAGPTTVGFDRFFGCAASWDMPPYVWIENDRVTVTDLTASSRPADRFGRSGLKDPRMKAEDAIPALTHEAVAFIEASARASDDAPFFLYFPLTAPHTPVVPNAPFQGRSKSGDYGDFVVETDWALGQVLDALDRAEVADETLVVFTSDNGPERFMQARKTEFDHYSAGIFRGCKRDNWEGGHRVPFVARWPGHIAPATSSDEVVCLTDMMATLAALVGEPPRHDSGEDSYNLLPVLLGQSHESPVREATVHHSSKGEFAIRRGRWVLLRHQGSGGNAYRQEGAGWEAAGQLYDLIEDPSQQTNRYDERPEIVRELSALLDRYQQSGRSRP